MAWIVKDSLLGFDQIRPCSEGFFRVRITIKTREITARDLEPDAMTRLEQITGHPKVDAIRINFSRLDQLQVDF